METNAFSYVYILQSIRVPDRELVADDDASAWFTITPLDGDAAERDASNFK